MSFFGFDAVLPERRNRPDVADDAFGAEEEDLAVYTWGEEEYDGLGDALAEEGDDFNDDTFGIGGEDDGPVGRDFDFHKQTALLSADRPTPPPKQDQQQQQQHQQQTTSTGHQRSDSNRASGLIPSLGSIEALWGAPASSSPGQNRSDVWSVPAQPRPGAIPSPISTPTRAGFSPFGESISTPPAPPTRRPQTLEEIEAEMRAATKPKPMTMEEIERDMMARQQQQFLQQQHYLQQQHLHHQQQQQQAYASPAPPHALQQQAFMSSPSLHQSQPNPSSSHQYPPQQPQQPYQNQIPPSNHAYSSPQPFSVQPRQNPNVPPPFPSSPAQAQAQAQRQPPPHQQQQQQPQQQRRPGPPQPTSSFSLADMFPALPGQEQSRAADPSTDVLGALAGLNEEERAMVKSDMERKIVEQEKADERRKRKAWKIAGMAQYNDIMTRSDKDFITRIQVSQLVTQDPYADDFYAQVYGAILRSKMGANGGPVGVLQLGRDGTGVGVGVPGGRGAGRRDFAMQRMTMQVKRIVDAAKQREGRKGDGAGLEGALGKISLRSYKTAPRPMLQTDSQNPASPAATKAEPVHKPTDPQQRFQGNPLTRRQTLIALESLYELVLQLEQLRRSQPPPPSQPASSGEGQGPAAGGSDEEKARYASWQAAYDAKVDEAWKGVMVDLPVEISFPHPFISLLTPTKGKRLLPRVLRHLSPSQTLTIFTLLLASFNQLDVVWNAPPPLPPYTKDEERREKETDVFLGAVVPAFLAVLDRCELRMVAGMVGLVAERCDVMALAKTRPGVVLLTVLLSRAEVLKQGSPEKPAPDAEELQQWQSSFDALFAHLIPHLPYLFPSSHVPPSFGPQLYVPKNPGGIDALDMPIWQMLGSLALHCGMQQQQALVGEMRDKILEGVVAAKQGWVDEETSRRKIANVDLLLVALGLDSSLLQ